MSRDQQRKWESAYNNPGLYIWGKINGNQDVKREVYLKIGNDQIRAVGYSGQQIKLQICNVI